MATGWGARYRGRNAWAVRHLDLRIEPAERVLLLGRSGSGKSTLLAAMAGLLEPETTEMEGELLVDGAPAWQAAAERTGILFQDPESQLVMGRVGDDVAFGLENRCVPTAQIPARILEALSAVDFPYGPERATEALSGGERQRLALAGVLALRPNLLLLDEPTASLDPEGAGTVRAAVARAVEGRDVTLVVVDHRADEWLPIVDRVVVVDGAHGVVADGPAVRYGPAPDHAAAPRAHRPGPALVVADGASFRYPGAAGDALAATDVQLRAGEALAVSGPSGSGKSTLALLLGGLLPPRSGSVHATAALDRARGEEPLARWPASTLARHVGSVFQDPEHQFLTASVRDEVMLGPRRIGLPEAEARARAEELLTAARMTQLAEANPFTLSGGEKRRLSVATALATRPEIVILDEPTFGQDDGDVADLVERLRGLRDDGTALCVITHDERLISSLADRTLTLGRPA